RTPLPRRSLSSPGGPDAYAAAAALARRRRHAARRALPRASLRRLRRVEQDALARRARGPPRVPVAGQRARARQPDGARRAAVEGSRSDGGRARPDAGRHGGAPGAGARRRVRWSELARRRCARPRRRGSAPDELEHLPHRGRARDLAQHPAGSYREVRAPVRRAAPSAPRSTSSLAPAPVPASTVPAPTLTPLRWERRRVTLLRASLI